ncbi:hypothetical protein F0U62_02965 [Cystobacter fuscus]|uniref:hypothetical protein n=1 Tax=Cystobacter fuscus TaxID=43 RepID=UPI002B31F38E|nr:hypothetical protein F0U62_02965 [Cystobacter fuscus]
MNDWRPKPIPLTALARLPLTAEEGFVLSRLDGATPVRHLTALTGLPPERIQAIIARLLTLGAVLPPPTSAAPPPTPAPAASTPATPPETPGEPLEAGEEEDAGGPEDENAEAHAGTFRQLFERRLHPLAADERARLARESGEPELSALCFDPVPAVIHALLENTRLGLAHARLIARHHLNPVGLEALCGRAAFASDAGVRRWLVRNPQLPAGLFRRLWGGRRLMEQFKVAGNRDVPEGTRRTAREVMRSRFGTAPAEERVELILLTEGRVLGALMGLPVDGKTAALLCGRVYRSPLLIQNLARWSAAPPALIAHLLKQEAVRRQPQLRQLLQRHPNAPADARRGD